jgi:sortase A
MRLLARLRTPVILVASVAVLGASVGFGGTPQRAPQATERVVPEATPKPVSPFTPVSVSIPDIDMDAPTVPVGTQADGAMGTPKNAVDIAWWQGRKAGQGNVLLAAHHDWNGRTGSFYRLDELEVGDKIVVTGDEPDKELIFYVTWKKSLDRNIDATEILGPQGDTDEFGKDGKPVATLITCGGVFDTSLRTHRERIVVRGELVPAGGEDEGPDVDPETKIDA